MRSCPQTSGPAAPIREQIAAAINRRCLCGVRAPDNRTLLGDRRSLVVVARLFIGRSGRPATRRWHRTGIDPDRDCDRVTDAWSTSAFCRTSGLERHEFIGAVSGGALVSPTLVQSTSDRCRGAWVRCQHALGEPDISTSQSIRRRRLRIPLPIRWVWRRTADITHRGPGRREIAVSAWRYPDAVTHTPSSSRRAGPDRGMTRFRTEFCQSPELISHTARSRP